MQAEDGGPLIKSAAKCLVIFFLLCGLAWSVTGFLWVFGARENETCGADSFTYQFAYATLIIMNIIMDVWICFKICVVLYWAFLTEDWFIHHSSGRYTYIIETASFYVFRCFKSTTKSSRIKKKKDIYTQRNRRSVAVHITIGKIFVLRVLINVY